MVAGMPPKFYDEGVQAPPPKGPDLVRQTRANEAGKRTSLQKLNGQVYTPDELAPRLLALLRWPGPHADARLLDPACGDGVFLAAAMKKAAASGARGPALKTIVEEKIEGWDIDADALKQCEQRLKQVSEALGLGGSIPRLRHRDGLTGAAEPYQCVIANPPYLEAKRMPDALKATIRARYPKAAHGAFDLYGAFLERADQLLTPDGELCFLIPNRFLVVRYAQALRQLLLERYATRLVDLSRERVFADAAVYPIVIHGQRSEQPSYEVGELGPQGEFEGVQLSPASLLDKLGGLMPLAPTAPEGRQLLAKILESPTLQPLESLAETRWCVSFHRAGLREQFLSEERPKSDHEMPFLGAGRFMGNREVQPFTIEWSGWWIDYDEARARQERNPLPSRALFEGPKLVICQNARRARAALDLEGRVLKDTFLALRSRAEPAEPWLRWFCLVLHSKLFHYLYEHLYAGTRKGGSFLHFLPRYLNPFPMPRPPDSKWVEAAYQESRALGSLSADGERLVRRAYGVDSAEEQALDAYDYPP